MNIINFVKRTSIASLYLAGSLLATNTWAVATCGSGAYANSESFSKDDASFSVEWGVCGDQLEMKMMGSGSGWIGVGFSDSKGMTSTDVVIAGVDSGGTGYIVDTWAFGRTSPDVDSSQDYSLISASEVSGNTTIEFSRALNTGDTEDDFALDNGAMYFLWAMGTDDYAGKGTDYHGTARGGYSGTIDFSVVTSPVPLPAGLPLLLTGLGVLGFSRRRGEK